MPLSIQGIFASALDPSMSPMEAEMRMQQDGVAPSFPSGVMSPGAVIFHHAGGDVDDLFSVPENEEPPFTPPEDGGSDVPPATPIPRSEFEMLIAQIAGHFEAVGHPVSFEEAEQLARFGFTQQAARSFARQARTQLPALQALAQRHHDPQDNFTVSNLIDALVYMDPDQARRHRRLFAAEQATFTPDARFRQDQQGRMTGLRQR